MKRLIDHHLHNWKNDPDRKSLLLRGARQVGKTYSCRKLGQSFEKFVEINFELNPRVSEIFDRDLDPQRIIRDLGLLTGEDIIPGRTLLFFDEIQESPKAIKSLRYFHELLPELHVIAAGSLLDFVLENIGIPVGRVASFYMYPMSFLEYVAAGDNQAIVDLIKGHDKEEPLGVPIHDKLLALLGEYLAIGGMPEVVLTWTNQKELKKCANIQALLVDAYRQDFSKYCKEFQVKYIDLIFDEIPRWLGRKFQFSKMPGNWRKRELAPAFELLKKASVAHKVIHTSANGLPLGGEANPNRFKAIFLDIGLAQAILGLDLAEWVLKPEASIVNRGALAEAFVGQEILAYSPPHKRGSLYYWHREAHASNAEVDFLLALRQNILPLEVKSGATGTLRSLHLFLEEKSAVSTHGIRFSGHNFSVYEKIHSYPLYAVANLFRDALQL
jgi:predicted AAA+ superfamily ATPase